MKDLNTEASYKSLKLTRGLINISLLIIFMVLLFFGKYNPAAAFALIFYNALHWLLLSKQHSQPSKKNNTVPSKFAELKVLRTTLPFGILLHAILGYGFLHKLPISVDMLKPLPVVLTVIIIIFRYTSYLFIKIMLIKSSR